MNYLHEIINRLMFSQGYKTKKELASALEISPSDLNNRIKSGSVKQLLIELAVHKKVNIDWLLTGNGNITMGNETRMVAENHEPYIRGGTGDIQNNDLGELIKQTTDVLLSNTKYGKALKENIEAFHMAVTDSPRHDDTTKKGNDPSRAAGGSNQATRKKVAL